jgi:hypothetical protein
MTYEIESIDYKDCRISIIQDDYPIDPRNEDFQTNFGKMCCWYRNHNLGDYKLVNDSSPDYFLLNLLQDWYDSEIVEKWYEEKDFTEFIEFAIDKLSEHAIVLPLVLLDHSGLCMRVGNSFAEDPGGWDSSRIGFIYATFEDIKNELCYTSRKKKNPDLKPVKRISKKLLEKARQMLINEVKEYSQYLEGDICAFKIFDEEEMIDSCYGFYDQEHCIQEAKSYVDWYQEAKSYVDWYVVDKQKRLDKESLIMTA